ncbi:hypothetical protein SAMN05216474_1570 [Lishizhenia tianjinensis]|uniref:Uncharacterized protein n=1 Tax=Lishizhenia tianjinensis TaxID=477690 RepID=A0A1I6ZRN9_9FLAO|nr:hypothetical protein [Lishizhenia tianjinensis]SFT65340.1 hypothetical protein SAMN05216474_1570 [Lishizhenia tianjinensis]
MRKILLLAFFSVIAFQSFTQSLVIPENPKLEKAEDYSAYEDLVVRCVDYLFDHPVDQNGAKRQECTEFLIKWMDGSPNVTVVLHADLVELNEGELLMAYLGAYVKYALEHKEAEAMACTLYAVERSIEMYEKNKDHLKKGKVMKKLLKAKKKGGLEAYVQEFVN